MWQVSQVQLAYGGHGPSTVTTDSIIVSRDRGLGASLKHQGLPGVGAMYIPLEYSF